MYKASSAANTHKIVFQCLKGNIVAGFVQSNEMCRFVSVLKIVINIFTAEKIVSLHPWLCILHLSTLAATEIVIM